tara:strand:+ start:49 stop:1311 length:1263 start_codon:yes stop_codon:yes gene_type:complete
MAELYNSSITTRLIDPVFDKEKFRSEFRLQPDTAYLTNLRLLNVGVSSAPAQALNPLTGSRGCIKSIQLFDGNQLLDQLLEASIYNGFKAFMNPNDANLSVNRFLNHNGLGYVASGNQTQDASTGKASRDSIKVRTQNTPEGTDGKAWVSVADMLPFLRSSLHLPTNVYRHLRLVVNWKNAGELKDMVAEDRTHTLSTYEGTILVVDEMNPSDSRQAVMDNYNGVVYRPVEHDSVDLPAITGIGTNSTKDQSNSNMVKGYNGKMLHDLLLVQTPTDESTYVSGNANTGYANQGSQSLYKSKYQIRVNGQNKLSRDGWSGHNQRLGQLVDTFGECNIIMGQNETFLAEGNNYIDNGTTLMGQLDYTALEVQEKVDELIVEVDRTGVDSNPALNQRIRLNMFGTTQKEVVMRNDGRYNVIYS